jgi:cell volume regulation protein A
MIDAFSIFTLIGVTLFLGYTSSIIFKKTQIPDVIWLLLFGFLIGPVFNLLDRSIFISISPLLASFALLIILFDAGLEMNLFTMIKQFPRSILISIVGIALTIISIAFSSVILFSFDWTRAFLLGAIIGGPSSAIVISIFKGLNVRDDVKTIMDLESILTDPIDVILTIAIVQIYVSTLPSYSIVGNIIGTFSIGAVIGFIAGIIWLISLSKIKDNFDYMLTLAILLLIYVFVESVNGSGAIAALAFGIVLGSGKIFSKALKFKKSISISPSLRKFHEEITFFVRSFFFVTMGIIVSINFNFIFAGIIITLVIALARIVTVAISTYKMNLTPLETNVMRIVIPQGLATAVMAYIPLVYGVPNGEIFLSIAFIIIMSTVIYTTIGMKIIYMRSKSKEKIKPKESQ